MFLGVKSVHSRSKLQQFQVSFDPQTGQYGHVNFISLHKDVKK